MNPLSKALVVVFRQIHHFDGDTIDYGARLWVRLLNEVMLEFTSRAGVITMEILENTIRKSLDDVGNVLHCFPSDFVLPPFLADICTKRPGILSPWNVPVTTLESGFPDAFPLFSAFPTAYTQPCAFPFPPSLFFNFRQLSLYIPGLILKTTIPLGSCPIALLSISNICVASTPIIAGKVPYLVALVALLDARAIVVKMALGALGKVSPIGFLHTIPIVSRPWLHSDFI
ncbi:hypothetical protein Tco_0604128 [Tanacetum coccineum]